MSEMKEVFQIAMGAILVAAISLMAASNITFDKNSVFFLTPDDVNNGITIIAGNDG